MTTVTHWKKLAIAVLGGALLLTACGRPADDAPTADDSAGTSEHGPFTPGVFESPDAGEPKDTEILTIADFTEARSLDPAVTIASGFAGGSALTAIYDQLVRWDEAKQTWEPHLAESVEHNDDFTEWTVTLRDGVTFSDGSPLNADAVVRSVNRYIKRKGYDMGVIGPSWGGVEKVDDRTVVFRLTKPWATFQTMLGQGMGMIVAPGADAGGEFRPIGAGAFTFSSYQPTEHLELVANPDYWDGEPPTKKLRFVWLGDDDTKVDAFEADNADLIVIRKPELVSDLREADQPGALLMQNQFSILINNREDRPGHSEKVRRALALALDAQGIVDRTYKGKGLPGKTLFATESRWHSDVEENPHDPEQARQLLDEAKAEGFDGRIQITGLQQDEALALQAQFEAVGFEVEVDLARTPADALQRVFVQRDFDLTMTPVPVMEEDPYQRLFANLHSQSAANVSGYTDPEMDKLIDELGAAQDDDRAAVLAKIEARYQEMAPNLTWAASTPFSAWKANVHGVVSTNTVMLAYDKAWKE